MKKLMQKAHKGATFIEYAMLAGLVAVVVAVAAMLFGDKLVDLFSTTGTKVEEVKTGVRAADFSGMKTSNQSQNQSQNQNKGPNS
jgi:Flp pilus assembly pilin Flp